MNNILSRKSYLKKRTTITIIASLVIILFIGCIFVQAKTPEEEIIQTGRTKYFVSIEVQKGDTLWSIAEEYMTEEYPSISSYIKDVKDINGFTGDKLYAGCYLVVPYYAD